MQVLNERLDVQSCNVAAAVRRKAGLLSEVQDAFSGRNCCDPMLEMINRTW